LRARIARLVPAQFLTYRAVAQLIEQADWAAHRAFVNRLVYV
jgi:hypothetical protein